MKVVTLETKKVGDTSRMLEVLEVLKQKVIDGEIAAFAIAGLGPDDATYAFTAGPGVTRLRVQGAIAQLMHAYASGELMGDD